jgi:hypothetical protein
MAYTVDRKAIKVGGQRDERLDPSHHVADECQLRQSSMRSVNSSQVIFPRRDLGRHGIGYVGIAYGA